MSKKNYVVMVAAIYPITPSSPMAEKVDEWSAKGKKNLFGTLVDVIQMQSEAGAAGTCHGSLQAGALTTTFTSSQGLMLMIPAMYAMGGQFLPSVMHIASRVVTSNHHSIFGDHTDFMTCRTTGKRPWIWRRWRTCPPSKRSTPSCTALTASAPPTRCSASRRWTMRSCGV